MSKEVPCTNNFLARGVYLFSLAIVATFIYLALQIPPVEAWFTTYIPDYEYRLFGKALLFFIAIYIVDQLTISLRKEIVLC